MKKTMLVQPPKFVIESLTEKIDASKSETKVSCLDKPKIAAVHLKTKEDLEMFYGQSQTSGFCAAFVWTFQVTVALIATLVAAVRHKVGSSGKLNNLPTEDLCSMDVDYLLDIRRSILEEV